MRIEKNVPARMRDGVTLRADVYRPATPGRYPALLQRTPYSKNDQASARRFSTIASRGYVVVVQDTRGRYTSDGVAIPHDEADDGYDSVQWAASLPGVDGRVGMFGGSYLATTQLEAATRQPPALVALFPASSYNRRHDMVFQGGAFYLSDGLGWNLGQASDVRRRVLTPGEDRDGPIGLNPAQSALLRSTWLWHLPLKGFNELDLDRFAPGYRQMLAHPDQDAFWDPSDIEARHNRFLVPAFHLTGWYDTLLAGTLRNFAGLRANAATDTARRYQRLVVGPWTHARPTTATTKIGDVDFGPEAGFDADGAMLGWFDHWLRGADRSAVDVAPGASLRDGGEPVAGRAGVAPVSRDDHGLTTSAAADRRPPRPATVAWTSPLPAPNLPTPSPTTRRIPCPPAPRAATRACPWIGGASSSARTSSCTPARRWRPTSRSPGRCRSPSGSRRARPTPTSPAPWWMSSPTAPLALSADGILRTRYRAGKRTPRLLTPGEPTEITIDLGATSNLFRSGHRIRVEVSSSNFPRFDRNPNTGGVFGEDREVRTARQAMLHDLAHPSRLLLPVVARSGAGDAGRGSAPAGGAPEIERRFLAGVSAESISAIHRQVTEHPHIAGSARSMEVADRVRRALDAAGLQTEVREYLVHLSTPRSVTVDIISPDLESLIVREMAHPADPARGASRVGARVRRLLGLGHRVGAGGLRQLWAAARLRPASPRPASTCAGRSPSPATRAAIVP